MHWDVSFLGYSTTHGTEKKHMARNMDRTMETGIMKGSGGSWLGRVRNINASCTGNSERL